MKQQNIYVIYTCDAWKSYDSMRLHAIARNEKTLMRIIKQMLRDGCVKFQNSLDNLNMDTIHTLDYCAVHQELLYG